MFIQLLNSATFPMWTSLLKIGVRYISLGYYSSYICSNNKKISKQNINRITQYPVYSHGMAMINLSVLFNKNETNVFYNDIKNRSLIVNQI